MSHQATLDSLHSSLSLETAKLVRWEVETVVNMRDREGQIQQTAGVTATQEQIIPQLEEENFKLRGELSSAKHEKEELGQRINHTRREVEVLGSQFIELQGELEKLRCGTNDLSKENLVEELTNSVRNLRFQASASRQEAMKTWEELESTREKDEEHDNFSLKEIAEKIKETRLGVESKEILVSQTQRKLHEVSAGNDGKRKQLDDAKACFDEESMRQVAQVENIREEETARKEEIIHLNVRVEKLEREMVDKAEQMEKMKTMAFSQEEEITRLIEEKEKKLLIKSSLDVALVKMEEDNDMSSEQVRIVLEEVDRLGKMVEEEDKVEKDLDMMRADLRVCEENRKMIETEVVANRRVEQQRVGLEKENMNMKSRAELLREKEESYSEDLDAFNRKMDEMAVKEQEILAKLNNLEKEDFKLDEELDALDKAASHAMDEAKLSDAGNKDLEENIRELMENIRNSKQVLEGLEKEETTSIKILKSVEAKINGITVATKSAQEEGKVKMIEIEETKKQGTDEASKLTMLETGLKKKLQEKQLMKSKQGTCNKEKVTLEEAMDLKRKYCSVLKEDKKVIYQEISAHEMESKELSGEKDKLLKTMAGLQLEMEAKRSDLADIDKDLAKEMDVAMKKHEECQADLDEAHKEISEITSLEEDFVKQLEEVDVKIKAQKVELLEKIKLEERLAKDLAAATKDNKCVEKDIKSVKADIAIKESKLRSDIQAVQGMKDELFESDKIRVDLNFEIEKLKMRKKADLEEFRAASDKKAVDNKKDLEEMEEKKMDLKHSIKETESKTEKLDLLKKTKKAKNKLEKVEKSKDCKVKKEKMLDEKKVLDFSLDKTRKEFAAQSSLAVTLQGEIKKLASVEVKMAEVDSDEENIATRRVISRSPSTTPLRNRSLLSLSNSTSTKRKLDESTSTTAKSSFDSVYQCGDSSDSEGQSQPKFLVPSTPRGRNVLSSRSNNSVPFTPSRKQQQVLSSTSNSQSHPVSFTSPSPSSVRNMSRPAATPARSVERKGKKVKEVQEMPPVNFDEVMALSSDLDSN